MKFFWKFFNYKIGQEFLGIREECFLANPRGTILSYIFRV